MSRACTVCAHPDRAEIDRALVGGQSCPQIAARYGTNGTIGRMALLRHKDHIPEALAKSEQAKDIANADNLLREARALRSKAISLLLQAEASGDLRTALAGVREARGCLELLARLTHEIDDRPQVNILVSPEWVLIRRVLMDALQPYPTARASVAQALVQVEGRVQ